MTQHRRDDLFGVPGSAERHVVAQDVVFDSVFIDDGGQALVRFRAWYVVEFDIV